MCITCKLSNRKDVIKMMIKRLYRQHTSTVLSIPKPILQAADLKTGDYVEIEVDTVSKQISLTKIKGRNEHGRKNEDDQGQHNQGRDA